jgi:hypothetical protein
MSFMVKKIFAVFFYPSHPFVVKRLLPLPFLSALSLMLLNIFSVYQCLSVANFFRKTPHS